ncbi:GNAT family N-acetyltransferase [Enterovirga rhinocerotis]|uniref:RimJ/RimL family protein N-acetyltransferase n=1 Tax=Enterovirga rhinocerotis TaxID=1339210 RepID=A0A4R7BRI3_9HYPH|nr:GNAT family N-acetyltransferase [Enterovirga rhinocerotis]TDR88258.1 RimJ/RimL family protein N-acetyltransferase [Enterovirga rhinocerotis]
MFPELTRDDVFRLETARLWLRWPRQADAAAIVRLAGEKAVAEMTARIPHPLPADEITAFVLKSRQANLEGRELTMAITPRSQPGSLIGIVSIHPDESAGAPHLGYWLGVPYWGEGFATEAARAMVDAFFAYAGGKELTSSARVINPASRRVLEKCGFSATGSGLQPFPARGGLFPVDHFRLERRGWRSFKAWTASGFVPQPRHEEGAAQP